MDNKKNKSTQIVEYLIELIQSGKVPINKIMPSEHQLMYKFECSRNIVVSAYKKLETLGAVYSIPKRGHFVAENFHNLIKPMQLLINADECYGDEIFGVDKLPDWATEKHIIFVQGFRKFVKQYYKDNVLIAESDIFISLKNIDEFEPINLRKSITDLLINRNALTNVVYEVSFEEGTEKFGLNPALTVILFGYDLDSISIAAKYYVNPKYFKFFHQEFALNY
ncbi:GntR family transcriptional regulator [Mycoplasma sp. NEAQ87857]|uniref:winged helix-turn-helix domain-containing protein n=1 Tax=Mycoplasma sp. NEAQ87857 TaxID=2683967 RepID=UPI0013179434|nr:GntR family transcriptional regulator [Mycoplasma sp. NEAQ87857]QGZ97222.1 GntR family transcriptional regulator [Mycoplasma sp. NEAQ87857]